MEPCTPIFLTLYRGLCYTMQGTILNIQMKQTVAWSSPARAYAPLSTVKKILDADLVNFPIDLTSDMLKRQNVGDYIGNLLESVPVCRSCFEHEATQSICANALHLTKCGCCKLDTCVLCTKQQ